MVQKTIPITADTKTISKRANKQYFLLAFFCKVLAWFSSLLASTRFLFVVIKSSEIIYKFYPCSLASTAISFMISFTRIVVCSTSFKSSFFYCKIFLSISKSISRLLSVNNDWVMPSFCSLLSSAYSFLGYLRLS